MKHFFTIAISALILSFSVTANAAEYKIDPEHSFVQFKIQHLGYSWLAGRFNKMEGTFNYDPTANEAAQNISVTVDTTSMDTNHEARDKHVSGVMGFTKFTTATFKSTNYKGDKNGGVMEGKLTINGVTKDVSIAVSKIGEGDDPWGGYRAGFEGKLTINRKDFGIDYELGPKSWEVKLDLYIEGIRK